MIIDINARRQWEAENLPAIPTSAQPAVTPQKTPPQNSFAVELDRYLISTEPNRSRQMLTVGETPNILKVLGAGQHSLFMSAGKIDKCMATEVTPTIMHPHHFSANDIKEIPALLANPVMILKGNVRGSIIAVTDKTDPNGDPVVIPVQLNGRNGLTTGNIVLSMYPRVYAFTPEPTIQDKSVGGFFQRQFTAGNLLAYNKEKLTDFLASGRLLVPADTAKFVSYNNIITQNLDFVKWGSEKNRNFFETNFGKVTVTLPEEVEPRPAMKSLGNIPRTKDVDDDGER
jgi:hypothetical protein